LDIPKVEAPSPKPAVPKPSDVTPEEKSPSVEEEEDPFFGFVDSGFLGDVDCSLAAGEVFTEAFRRLLETGSTNCCP
jgi:hypothetical protein